jgi:hypothetical protein
MAENPTDLLAELLGRVITVTGATQQDFASLRHVCRELGMDWNAQHQRLLRDERLARHRVTLTVPTTGGPQRVICLPVELIPEWLLGIDVARLQWQVRERVIHYQQMCRVILRSR